MNLNVLIGAYNSLHVIARSIATKQSSQTTMK